MSYADLTTRDQNAFKRWLQRRRFADALKVFRKHSEAAAPLKVMDYGAGNGELIRQLSELQPLEATVFEPTPALMKEAKSHLADLETVSFARSLKKVPTDHFDYVFCLEVFEHLPPEQTEHAIAEIHRLLKPEGLAVIGVPHELFLPALLKGVFRMGRRYGAFDARPGNILSACRGRAPSERPTTEIAPGKPYHPHHLGFDYRRLEQLLQQRFQLKARWFSPFPLLGASLNSEVYFLLQKVRL
ncbi:bifunctional 2-polyprenyl-6-hydroxyphenol methylase/3-demethylubiquinol 3-O-methyltransferase UbiG [Marinimicrobium sp. ABcell2]|uniref:class I SAM-dependent methyltransferase n=1 Tax=Marinimicrobium sp. ABcell2 TaxID=3069751 RepID=UPI0027B43530|nr:class I SAM-dependent methyltransferase [Marinimicrobium sp. ABcell2]MDQ2077882.1 class I SAM-dependent methyltransferase [Marinimicrobium sp. ABcell2]